MILLTDDQKAALELQLKKAREASERNRLCVILGHNEGLSIDNLSKYLRISRTSVCDYINDFDTKQKNKNDQKGGTAPKLTENQSEALAKHLNQTTYLKVKSIQAYVQSIFGIVYRPMSSVCFSPVFPIPLTAP